MDRVEYYVRVDPVFLVLQGRLHTGYTLEFSWEGTKQKIHRLWTDYQGLNDHLLQTHGFKAEVELPAGHTSWFSTQPDPSVVVEQARCLSVFFSQIFEQNNLMLYRCKTWLKFICERPEYISLDQPDKAGYLTKEGHFYKTWKKRWFILKDDTLYYFESRENMKLKGSISLKNRVVKIAREKGMPFAFVLRPYDQRQLQCPSEKKIFYLVAECEADMMDWIKVLKKQSIPLIRSRWRPDGTGSLKDIQLDDIKLPRKMEVPEVKCTTISELRRKMEQDMSNFLQDLTAYSVGLKKSEKFDMILRKIKQLRTIANQMLSTNWTATESDILVIVQSTNELLYLYRDEDPSTNAYVTRLLFVITQFKHDLPALFEEKPKPTGRPPLVLPTKPPVQPKKRAFLSQPESFESFKNPSNPLYLSQMDVSNSSSNLTDSSTTQQQQQEESLNPVGSLEEYTRPAPSSRNQVQRIMTPELQFSVSPVVPAARLPVAHFNMNVSSDSSGSPIIPKLSLSKDEVTFLDGAGDSGIHFDSDATERARVDALWNEKKLFQSLSIPRGISSEEDIELGPLNTSWHPLLSPRAEEHEVTDEWEFIPPTLEKQPTPEFDDFLRQMLPRFSGPEGVPIKNRQWYFRTYENCFVGREAVDWMVSNKYAKTRTDAVFLGKRLVYKGEITHVVQEHDFEDGYYFYRFVDSSVTSNCLLTPGRSSPVTSPRDESSGSGSLRTSSTSLRKSITLSGALKKSQTDFQLRRDSTSGSESSLSRSSPRTVVCRICEEGVSSENFKQHTIYCMIASKCDQVSQGCDANLTKLKDVLKSSNVTGQGKKEVDRLIEICEAGVNVTYDQLAAGMSVLEKLIERTEVLVTNSQEPATIAFGNKLTKILSKKFSSLREYTTVVDSQPISEPTTTGSSILNFFWKMSRPPVGPVGRRLTLPDGTSSPRRNNSTIRDFEIVKPLSSGGFGRVYLAKKTKTGDCYAIKVMKKSHLNQKNISALNERNAMAFANRSFVCNLYYAFQSRELLFLVMEYLSGGDLNSLLSRVGQFTPTTTRYYIAEIVLILEYLHSIGIIHKDIKPSNFLLTANGHLKITDFGLSKITYCLGREQSEEIGCLDPLIDLQTEPTSQQEARPRGILGTPDYLSPEVLLGHTQNSHPTAVDWWAVGVITFEFLTGVPPFTDATPEEIFQHIVNREMLDWPEDGDEDVPESAKDFVDQMLQLDPKDRLGSHGVKELKNHEFLQTINWNTVFETSLDELQISMSQLCPEETQKPENNSAMMTRGGGTGRFSKGSQAIHESRVIGGPLSVVSDSTSPSNNLGLSLSNISLDSLHVDLSKSCEIPNFSFVNLHYLKEKNREVMDIIESESQQRDEKY